MYVNIFTTQNYMVIFIVTIKNQVVCLWGIMTHQERKNGSN